jgi:hypothetical protein
LVPRLLVSIPGRRLPHSRAADNSRLGGRQN